MIIALLIGIIVGFIICIPVGPINVSVVNALLRYNFRSAFSIALGGSLMDFVYFMIILTGLSYFHFSNKTVLFLKIIGIIFLLGYGIKELLVKRGQFLDNQAPLIKTPKASGFFLMGVLIYSSNPTLVATMSALAAVIKSWNLFSYNYTNYLSLSFGLAVGSALWFYLFLRVVAKYKNKIPEKIYINFARSCGILIILLSFYMAIIVYKENVI